MKLVIATRNKHKLEELRALLAGWPVELRSALDFPGVPEVEEDADTFEANAIKKAVTFARGTGCWALADDSGLEVAALNNAPGVYSARYAGEPADYPANNAKLLRELGGKPDRRACFRCVIALSDPQGRAVTVEGRCAGRILAALRGKAGFGYDPLFVPDGYTQTFAELPADVKNAISHRGRALQAARDCWNEIFAERGTGNPAAILERGAGSPAHPEENPTAPSCGRGFQPRGIDAEVQRPPPAGKISSRGRGFQPRENSPTTTTTPALPHSAALCKHRFDASGHIYFVTKRRAAQVGVDLSQPPAASETISALFWLVEQQRIWLLGFVLMPDHCHIVLAPRTPYTLKQVLHSLFSFSAQQINKQLHRHGALWMDEYFERHLRDKDETRQCLAYLHLNPVRKGLVQKAEDWLYSSSHPRLHDKMNWDWYLGMGGD